MKLQEAKSYLRGPIPSLRPGFDADGEIDHKSVRKIIDQAIDGGSKTIMLTCGDSHYDILTDAEIADLTKITVEHTAGRTMVIAADRYYSTKHATEFATYCKQLGVDMYMALPPDWACSCTPQTMAEHYIALAEIMPIMIVTNIFIKRGTSFGLETLKRALDMSKNIIAIKDDMCGTFAHDICMQFNERCAIIAGGQKRNHMNMYPYGCDGYLSTFATFNPKISTAYWTAIEKNELQTATKIISEKDVPFFQYISTMTGNFDAAMHGMLELYGLGSRYKRKPYYTISSNDLEKLKQFLIEKKLLNQ